MQYNRRWQGQPVGWRNVVMETNLVWDLLYMALIHPLSWEITPWISVEDVPSSQYHTPRWRLLQ